MNFIGLVLILFGLCVMVAGVLIVFRKSHRATPSTSVEWTDPLDPHGDGTLRPGDTVYDAMMRGETVVGNFGSDGWVFKETKR